MKGSGSKIDLQTWKNLMLLGQKQGSIRLKDLAQEMGLGEEETLVFLREVFPPGTGAEVYHNESELWVDINADAIQYMLPLTPTEWMQLHQLLESQDSNHPAMVSLKKKVIDSGPVKVVMELLGQLELWEHQLSEHQQKLVALLDEAVTERKSMQISTHEGKKYNVFPCKVVHLEGVLSLIAEDSKDHCLTVISLRDLSDTHDAPTGTSSKVSNYEIEEFIAAIRSMNEKETRLILKIHDPSAVNLFPEYHFLGKPCMITNPNGDLIWAAYVEACEPLYEWLMSLGTHVEIIDPAKFKDEYLSYCEAKIRKVA